jgi:hypothetical protein
VRLGKLPKPIFGVQCFQSTVTTGRTASGGKKIQPAHNRNPQTMKFTKCPYRKEKRKITNRRLKIAENKRRKKIESVPLFPEWMDAQLPSAHERLERIDESKLLYFQFMRNSLANNWKIARGFLRIIPIDDRRRLLKKWAESKMPKSPEYLLDLLRRYNSKWFEQFQQQWYEEGKCKSEECEELYWKLRRIRK